MARPVYLIFAGVNGAGKSTFYHTNFWKTKDIPKSIARINPDEILLKEGLDSASEADQLIAGKMTLNLINQCIDGRKSFNQETTLTGRLSLKTIEQAKSEGYKIIMYYIGVASPQIALKRIEHRVSLGGHNIPEDVVRRRFNVSLSNLSRAVQMCDEVTIIDNTVGISTIARWNNAVMSWVGDINSKGLWLLDAIKDDKIWMHA